MSFQVSQMASKFRGALLGGLIGDCLGAPFEGDSAVSKRVLVNYIKQMMTDNERAFQVFPYTDDSAMTKSVARSLLVNQGFDDKDMAKRFTMEYFKEPKRGYGGAVIDVFRALKYTNYEDPLRPAQMQFGGSGSYGNGAAMRIAPVALFGSTLTKEELIKLSYDCSKITHTHENALNGAALQCLAVHTAVHMPLDPTKSEDVAKFLELLITTMSQVEVKNNEETPYVKRLEYIKKDMLSEDLNKEFTTEDIVEKLGNDVSALNSVPTAIYLFIRAHRPVKEMETDNVFVRALYLAISLGGDTDTIASMTCTLVGALHGEGAIPPLLVKRCESNEKMIHLADELCKNVKA